MILYLPAVLLLATHFLLLSSSLWPVFACCPFSAVGRDKQSGPRSGFFHNFTKQEILVKKWDPYLEGKQCLCMCVCVCVQVCVCACVWHIWMYVSDLAYRILHRWGYWLRMEVCPHCQERAWSPLTSTTTWAPQPLLTTPTAPPSLSASAMMHLLARFRQHIQTILWVVFFFFFSLSECFAMSMCVDV